MEARMIKAGRREYVQVTLKLPTFLREYDKLARHCAAEGLDHACGSSPGWWSWS